MTNKYTFEDWLIDEELFTPEYIPEMDDTIEVKKTDSFLVRLLETNQLDRVEFDKIRAAQSKAFNIVKEFHFNKMDEAILNTLASSINKNQYLRKRIGNIEIELNSVNPKMLELVYAGKESYSDINGQVYTEILRRSEQGLDQDRIKNIVLKQTENNKATDNTAEYFKALLLVYELERLNHYLHQGNESEVTEKSVSEIKSRLTKQDIFKKYHLLYNDGLNMKQEAAYEQIEDWLLNQLGFSEQEIKKQFNITMGFESFTRNARNNRV